ncbi:unnamed protein product (plasmid) [Mycetohabitans rhizoxinica HKI 454]|uniref:Uncharacterized protein n=1 Tax=Mycetohabitans rhizoxinica (strain DSM 19002 / CIP 109453 / HKI 454) TaxID=882378 RepID=E5AU14_MYCRK|nr:unnamed protein product [Mycetohabitans rhizoxinica HKI 454]
MYLAQQVNTTYRDERFIYADFSDAPSGKILRVGVVG